MKTLSRLFFAVLLTLATAGCGKPDTESIKVDGATVMVDAASETVKVYLVDSSGKKTLLGDTHASRRMGWSFEKIDASRLKLTTGEAGDFNIRNGPGGWEVVPVGVFVSPSSDRIVRLSENGTTLIASIGEGWPPCTECTITSSVMLSNTSIKGLDVRWMGADDAHVIDSTGKVVAMLKHKERQLEKLGDW